MQGGVLILYILFAFLLIWGTYKRTLQVKGAVAFAAVWCGCFLAVKLLELEPTVFWLGAPTAVLDAILVIKVLGVNPRVR